MKRLSRLLLLMLLMETWVIAAESPIAGTRRDQGKTTLVDAMLRQSGIFREGEQVLAGRKEFVARTAKAAVCIAIPQFLVFLARILHVS